MQFPQRIQLAQPTATAEPRLPTYEEVMGEDLARLPSYSKSSKTRYRPYRRPAITIKDSIARLFNTIYDEEAVLLNGIPPETPGRPQDFPLVPRPLVPLVARRRHANHGNFFRERELRLGAAILNEFIAGLRRAQVG